ncbi:hypothetical protein PTT_07613 [Pyrenophora teres f. teres 0-1]|uniref:Uncharacterized protein n=1 Tax=Pyrenophora teres f. teres (strain 0-1) TaxID=861557 RepID=E3RI19_PYRTT|nr:hypothetical protein PTT_07613 [Pyrenophora teres f. teres 0-1]
MAPRKTLGIKPQLLNDTSDLTDAIRGAYNRPNTHTPVHATIAGNGGDATAFIAISPDVALRWICRRVHKKNLIAFISHVYDSPMEEIADTEAEQDNEDDDNEGGERRNEEDIQRAGGEGHHKRTRDGDGASTRQVNKRLKDQLQEAMLRTVASTQELNIAKGNQITASEEEERYRAFAQHLPGAGISVVASIIAKAAAVGTAECMKDWKIVLRAWREQHSKGETLFSDPIQDLPAITE